MNPREFVDEYRFLFELMAAVFIMPFITCEKRKNFRIFFPLAVVLLTLVVSVKPFFARYWVKLSVAAMNTLFISWYVFITLLVFLSMLSVFKVSFNDAVLFLVAGYALQHISYVLVCELMALLIPLLSRKLAVYAVTNVIVSVGFGNGAVTGISCLFDSNGIFFPILFQCPG